ncbi:6-carboxytetrahydropterin synthase QueD [Chitinophaga defluvii]|uniref:6-carboxy-5,6,7,8-tetrahydropterin synthase n=1 Tax=Chitinophaga defluvii TaxID=3163343 RepID=A0ABV2T6D6_9BACT
MIISKQFIFDAAHFLPNVPDGHKCKNIHGHTYHLTVLIDGPLQENLGWVIDYGDLKKAIAPVIEQVDHQLLNNIPGLENPTSEMLVVWIWQQIKPVLPLLKRLELYETPTSGVIYEG